jgi:hypothetical protein
MNYSPICIFIYNRKEKVISLLNSLFLCEEFKHSPIYIFSDGAKNNDSIDTVNVNETRAISKSMLRDYDVKYFIRDENLGLARSICYGVTEVLKSSDRVVVFEDDLIVDKSILTFFNHFLTELKDFSNVFQISGHLFFDTNKVIGPSNFYMPLTNSWGWATWADSWNKFDYNYLMDKKIKLNRKQTFKFNLNDSYNFNKILSRQYSDRVNSWAILWYLTVFINNGLVLYPNRTLVLNKGLDGTGTNTFLEEYQLDFSNIEVLLKTPELMNSENDSSKKVMEFMKKNISKNIFQKVLFKLKNY